MPINVKFFITFSNFMPPAILPHRLDTAAPQMPQSQMTATDSDLQQTQRLNDKMPAHMDGLGPDPDPLRNTPSTSTQQRQRVTHSFVYVTPPTTTTTAMPTTTTSAMPTTAAAAAANMNGMPNRRVTHSFVYVLPMQQTTTTTTTMSSTEDSAAAYVTEATTSADRRTVKVDESVASKVEDMNVASGESVPVTNAMPMSGITTESSVSLMMSSNADAPMTAATAGSESNMINAGETVAHNDRPNIISTSMPNPDNGQMNTNIANINATEVTMSGGGGGFSMSVANGMESNIVSEPIEHSMDGDGANKVPNQIPTAMEEATVAATMMTETEMTTMMVNSQTVDITVTSQMAAAPTTESANDAVPPVSPMASAVDSMFTMSPVMPIVETAGKPMPSDLMEISVDSTMSAMSPELTITGVESTTMSHSEITMPSAPVIATTTESSLTIPNANPADAMQPELQATVNTDTIQQQPEIPTSSSVVAMAITMPSIMNSGPTASQRPAEIEAEDDSVAVADAAQTTVMMAATTLTTTAPKTMGGKKNSTKGGKRPGSRASRSDANCLVALAAGVMVTWIIA